MESTQSTTQNVLDFNKICRTCLSTENLLPICGALHSDLTSIEFVLNKYAYIKFDPTDKLPKQICSRCFKKLNSAYAFLKNCDFINTALIDCLTRFENSLQNSVGEQNVADSLEIKEEPQEFQMDYGNEIPITENAPPLEDAYPTSDIKEEPEVVIETFDENIIFRGEQELNQEKNEIQIISDGLKTVLQNQFKKKILSKQVAKKKCIFCDKKLWIRRSKKCDPSLQAEYCECRIEKCEICVKFFKNYKYLSKHMLTHQ